MNEEFIYKWQTLIGSALGPFLAVIVSIMGYLLKEAHSKRKEQKEHLRIIETFISMGLDDVTNIREQLKLFSQDIKQLSEDIKTTPTDHFSLDTINFPTISDAYRYTDVINIKVKSYYLHNKVLFADAYIKIINQAIIDLKNDFKGLIEHNETLITLMKDQPNYQAQKTMYSTNLYNFSVAIDEFIKKSIPKIIEVMNQIKVYNSKLREKYGFLFLWKNEGESLKYFRNDKEKDEFLRSLNSLSRIDELIQQDVRSAIDAAENRLNFNRNKEINSSKKTN